VAEECRIDGTILRLEFKPQSTAQCHHNLHNSEHDNHVFYNTYNMHVHEGCTVHPFHPTFGMHTCTI